MLITIRVIFDGKSFIPQETVSLPSQSEAIVVVNDVEEPSRNQIDLAIKAYYADASDSAEDEEWGEAAEVDSKAAWDGE